MDCNQEKSLLQAIKKGDRKAFKTLVEIHQSQVIKTCYQFVVNDEEAKDLAQEVFMEVYRSIRSFKEESSLKTWIYRISINKSLDCLRRKKRKKRFHFIIPYLSSERSNTDCIPDQTISIHDQLEEQEKIKALSIALDNLPEKQRVAITLNKFDELTSVEIGRILGISSGAVESLIHRAKLNLKKKLIEYYKKN